MRAKTIVADLTLLVVAAIWGSTFTLVKDSLSTVGPFTFLALRMPIAAALLVLWSLARPRPRPRSNPGPGLFVGLFLFGGYAFQTAGLELTSASRTAFLTGTYVAVVPLLSGWILGQRPARSAWAAVALALFGTALMTVPSGEGLGWGDVLVLLCAVCFACQILTVSRFAPSTDTLDFVGGQLAVTAILSVAFAIGLEGWRPVDMLTLPANVWTAVLLTASLATTFAFWAQSRAQLFTSPTHTALIFATEPVFATLYAAAFGGEHLTMMTIAGGAVIVCAMGLGGLSELSLSRSICKENEGTTICDRGKDIGGRN